MWVNFDDLSLESRVWVFQADRILTKDEQRAIYGLLKDFFSQWSTHGAQMHSSHLIVHNCFVVIAADEQKQEASGCSIDSFIAIFKKIGEQFNLSFFDRFSIAYKFNTDVVVSSLDQFKSSIKRGDITKNTIVFNNLIASKKDLLNKWELPLYESWQKRYL